MSMPRKAKTKRLYLIPVLTKALDILELLQSQSEPLVLEAIHKQTKVSKTTVYRILKTLVHRGYVGQTPDRGYHYIARPKKVRFGFGGQSAEMPFSQAVTASLKQAAAGLGVDLIVMDNCYDAETAVRNAESFVREGVDVVIEFQVEQHAAPIIADRIAAANIPLIAIDIPHPHSTYFGVDNYRVGYEAGSLLAEYALNRWGGKMDWMLGLDLEEAGQLVQSRITGAFEAVKTTLQNIPPESFVRVDGRGLSTASYKVVYDFLNRHPNATRILIAAANDTSALGAIAALRELGRERHAVVVGQDFVDEMALEMRRAGTPAIGSVSHEASLYGPRLIELGLSLLRGDKVAPYNFIEHKVITTPQLKRRTKATPTLIKTKAAATGKRAVKA
ncbi:substrate-binding domain-containing protein [Granulicella sp. WH15]|uniref:substrate-binding domain-containing protein n=1 Tax=Granulicella sp. WH15 TaxID=2602070 RepID=UPI0031F71B18